MSLVQQDKSIAESEELKKEEDLIDKSFELSDGEVSEKHLAINIGTGLGLLMDKGK